MIQDIEDREFDEIVEKATATVLVEFWQPGCGSCPALQQELERIQTELGKRLTIYTMNVQENFCNPRRTWNPLPTSSGPLCRWEI